FPRERIHSWYEYYCRAAEFVVRRLTEHTTEGHLYRVDMRLRPDGASGPVAMARRAYEEYYETRGELWERQMLLKARVVAGDQQTGEKLLKGLRPFVHPSTTLHNPLDEIKAIKIRIETSLGERQNVKLSRGGIRDIEFVVQALQLLKSGSDDSIRDGNTIRSIEKLRDASLLSSSEAQTLRKGYEFLRRVEHRLQLLHGTQTHELPEKREEMRLLAKRMGFRSASAFEKELAATQANMRRVYDSVFRTGPKGHSRSRGSAGVPARAGRELSRFGFLEAGEARRVLERLGTDFELLRDPSTVNSLLQLLKTNGAPDRGLGNFAVLASSSPVKRIIAQALTNQHTLEFLLKICSRSSRVARTLAEQPLLLESALGRTADFFKPGLEWQFLLPHDPFRFRLFNETKTAVRFLMGEGGIADVMRELTNIAETVVVGMLDEHRQTLPSLATNLCVVGLGKFGGGELLPGSDLDLLILYRHEREKGEREYQRQAAELPGLFKTEGGTVYAIDFRLRPEGKNAPLATDFSYYEKYVVDRAELWEKQSLLKARVVYDTAGLGGAFQQLRRNVLSGVICRKDWLRDVQSMRRRMEVERTKEQTRRKELKAGKGGLLDLEFAVQTLQMRYFGNDDPVDAVNTLDAIDRLAARRILKKPLLETIRSNYPFMRTLEFLIRLNTETTDFIIPGDVRLLRAVASGCGLRSERNLLRKIRTVRTGNRHLLKTVFATVHR
ncbi:MAG TPA: hypothetical protein VMM37_01055, partial [Bacteroidota bacterium]|nr:hypothetical protein [Bacteroidota bacterium]